MSLLRARAVAVALSVAIAAHLRAQSGADVAALLAEPVRPATLIQLKEYASDPRVHELLRTAIGDARPEVRAMAARIVFVARPAADFAPALATALSQEPDADVAREQIRALASMKPSDSDAAIFAAWRRFGQALAAETYATIRNAAALPALAHLQGMGMPRETQTIFAVAAIGDSTETLRSAMSSALASRDWATLRVTFQVADTRHLDPGDVLLSKLLTAPDASPARLSAMWYVLGGRDVGAILRQSLETALTLDTAVENVDAREQAVVLEFTGRLLGRPARTDAAWPGILRPAPRNTNPVSTAYPDTLLMRPGILARITDAEARSAGITLPPPDVRRARIQSGASTRPATTRQANNAGSIQTISGFPPGVIADVLARTGCTTAPTGRAGVAVRVSFEPDGRVANSSPSEPKASPECVAAMQLLTGAYVKQPSAYNPIMPASTTAPELLALPLLTPFIQCADRAAGPVLNGGTAPRDHPRMLGRTPEFSSRNISFMGLIASSGCVHEMAVVQSDNPKDNWSALTDAVLWRFAPFPTAGPPMSFRYSFSKSSR